MLQLSGVPTKPCTNGRTGFLSLKERASEMISLNAVVCGVSTQSLSYSGGPEGTVQTFDLQQGWADDLVNTMLAVHCTGWIPRPLKTWCSDVPCTVPVLVGGDRQPLQSLRASQASGHLATASVGP